MNRFITDIIEVLEENLNEVAMTENGDPKLAVRLMKAYLRIIDTTNDFRIYADVVGRIGVLACEYPDTRKLTVGYDLQ